MTASLKTVPVDGFSAQAIAAMQYDHIIDNHRFADGVERVLARYNEDTATFPAAGELAARGFYVAAIAVGLYHGRFDAQFVAQKVAEVADCEVNVHEANRELVRQAQGRGRNRLPVTIALLKAVGFDTDVVADCVESGAMEQEALDELVKSVLRGKTSVEHANIGLAHTYENAMAERRERRIAA